MEFDFNISTDEFEKLNSNNNSEDKVENDNYSEDEDDDVFNSKISTIFQIFADRRALENLIETAGSEAKRKSKIFAGKWVQVFKKGISENEKNKNKLLVTIARVHE